MLGVRRLIPVFIVMLVASFVPRGALGLDTDIFTGTQVSPNVLILAEKR